MTKGRLAELADVIGRQHRIYRELKQVLESEGKILVSGQGEGTEELLRKQEELTARITELEPVKRSLMDSAAAEAGIKNPAGASMKEIIEASGDPDGSLKKAVEGLLGAAGEVESINRSNRHMLMNFVEYADFAKAAGEKYGAQDGAVYRPAGRAQDKPKSSPKIDRTI